MTDKDKKILELFTKFLKHQKCDHARFEADPYNYSTHRGRGFICMENEDYGNLTKSIINMDEVIKNICEENNDEIFEEDGYTVIRPGEYNDSVPVGQSDFGRSLDILKGCKMMLTLQEENMIIGLADKFKYIVAK